MKKLRILCLHGYHGSAKVLRDQMSALAGGLGELAEFVYVDAPSRASGDFGWWHAVDNDDDESTGSGLTNIGRRIKEYKGWSRTYEWVISIFKREGPFDGVLGFSQGAALAALLVGLRAPDGKPTASKPLVFDFVILAGAFLANDPALAQLYESQASYDLPSVHIVGRADFVVPGVQSYRVASTFKSPLVLEHDGGHVIAATPEIRQAVASFLKKRIPDQRRKA